MVANEWESASAAKLSSMQLLQYKHVLGNMPMALDNGGMPHLYMYLCTVAHTVLLSSASQ